MPGWVFCYCSSSPVQSNEDPIRFGSFSGPEAPGTAHPKPAINFRSLRGIARQAITTTKNYNNFAAARLTSSTSGAGVLLSYCLSSPVL